MNHPTNEMLETLLEGGLPAAEAEGLRAHVAGCEACTVELAATARLFERLRSSPVWDPGPALTERVLDRVLPSRLRRRWVTALGWSYGTTSAVCTYAIAAWVSHPETPGWVAGQIGQAWLRVLQAALFTIHSIAFSGVRLLEGWGAFEALLARLGPIVRVLALPLAQPVLAAIISAAVVACVATLWWMRPRTRTATEEVHHVDLLGF